MTLLAAGPGEPLGTGGRYDDLLSRYDAPAPATGFAFEVDNVLWALSEAGVSLKGELPIRVIVAGGGVTGRRNTAELWRNRGARVAVLATKNVSEAKQYAKAWDYDLLIWQRGKDARLTRLQDGNTRALKGELSDQSFVELSSWARVGNES
jgi:ATP phosphoribosyltransferase regulatory subunit